MSKAVPGACSRAWWLGQWQGSLSLLCVGVWLFLFLADRLQVWSLRVSCRGLQSVFKLLSKSQILLLIIHRS